MKELIKKMLPPFILSWYHKILALLAMAVYSNPSNKLIVIGVTGTNGKSSVVNLIGDVLEKTGYKVAWSSTVNFKIAGKDWLNNKKMTMLGRFQTQKFLKQAVQVECKYAVIETSSEGIKQFRHLGINYDIAVFTNLTPEHIESHGGFDNYKKAKGELFKHLTSKTKKTISGKQIDKVIVANNDDEYAQYFLNFKADKKITFSIDQHSDFKATDVKLESNGSWFMVHGSSFKTNLLGKVNIYNYLAAIAVAKSQNIDDKKIKQALLTYQGIPGRFEFIKTDQGFKVMVDYAPEPESLKQLYNTLKIFNFNKIIHVLGSCGGGRDVSRQPVLGKMAAENSDYVIITNEDPYDDDPQKIIDNVATGAEANGKTLDKDLFKILDRHEAIHLQLMTTWF